MAQSIVTPQNLLQAVEEIKQFIGDNSGITPIVSSGIKLKFKNEMITGSNRQQYIINDERTSYIKKISRKAKNQKIRDYILSNELTIGDSGDSFDFDTNISIDVLRDLYTRTYEYEYDDNDNIIGEYELQPKLHLKYSYSDIINQNKSRNVTKYNIWVICGYEYHGIDPETEETLDIEWERLCNVYEHSNRKANIVFACPSDGYDVLVTFEPSEIFSDSNYPDDRDLEGKLSYVRFCKVPAIKNIEDDPTRSFRFDSLIALDSELWITDESGKITTENESNYYLYIERWNSKKQRWSAFLNYSEIHPIKFSEMEKIESDSGGNTYYRFPFSAYNFLCTLKRIEKHPSLNIRIGIATDFQYDSIQGGKYVNPKLINKSEQTTVKVYGHRFIHSVFNDTSNTTWLLTDLIQMRFTTTAHKYQKYQ